MSLRFICSLRVNGENLFKTFLHQPSCFQDGCHPFLELVCALSTDCFDQLSSNFGQSLKLLMKRGLLMLDKIKNTAARGDFVKCNFTDVRHDVKYHNVCHNACRQCLKDVPIVFF